MDLHAAVVEDVTLAPGERALISTGLRIALPPGYVAQVRARLLQLSQQRLLGLRGAGDDLGDEIDLTHGRDGLPVGSLGGGAMGLAQGVQHRVDADVAALVVSGRERPVVAGVRSRL